MFCNWSGIIEEECKDLDRNDIDLGYEHCANCLARKVRELKDKVRRRNLQIKKLNYCSQCNGKIKVATVCYSCAVKPLNY